MKSDKRTIDIREELHWLQGEGIPFRLLLFLVESLLGVGRLNRHLQRAGERDRETSVADYLETLRRELGYEVHAEESPIGLLPREGAVIVVANHPFGGPDAVALAHFLTHRRADARVLANEFLCSVESAREIMIPMTVFSDDRLERRKNVSAIRSALVHLARGGALGLFPSGEVGHWVRGEFRASESAWSNLLVTLARRSGAPVVPVGIPGTNSVLFHLLGWVHPFLRTAWLPREILQKKGHRIGLRVGEKMFPVEAETDEQFLRRVRERVLELAKSP